MNEINWEPIILYAIHIFALGMQGFLAFKAQSDPRWAAVMAAISGGQSLVPLPTLPKIGGVKP